MPGKTGAGHLNERVAFDRRVTLDDGHGNKRGEFEERFQCWGGYTYLRGGETVIAARLEGRQPIVVRIRSSSASRAVAPDWRMRDLRTGVAYAVQSVTRSDDRAFVDVMVQSGTAP